MKRIIVNEELNKLRFEMGLSEEIIENDAERLFNIASQNKVGNKIMANVPLYLIYIDDTYQRTETFSKAKASEIAANFIEAAYDPIKLNYRDGRFYCPAGQHRIYAHMLMHREYIGAELFQSDYESEIDIFLTQDDNRSKLTPYDRYKAGLAAGKYEDVTLTKICNRYGVRIGTKAKASDTQLGSITTAKGILNQYGEKGLIWIFDIIESAGWKNQIRAFDSRTFRALKRVYSFKPDDLTKQRMIKAMSETTPLNLCALALIAYPSHDVELALSNYLLDAAKGKNVSKMA